MKPCISHTTLPDLLVQFNKRDSKTFGKVYNLFYNELLHFIAKLYRDTHLLPQDVLQDLFMKLWLKKEVTFESLEQVKGYMYISIRNGFREFLSHQEVEEKYRHAIKTTDDYFITRIVETEILSELNRLPELLPAECAKVLKLYLEGYKIKDIAVKLNKSQSTVYAQHQKGVGILRKLYGPKNLFWLNLLFP